MADTIENDDILEDAMTPEEKEAHETAEAEAELARQERIESLAKVLVKHRDAAITFRVGSGIERQWAEDQAYYEGSDDNARSEYYKGLTQDSPLIKKAKSRYRSRVFLNITRPYVETAASKVIEVLCPTDARMWSIEPTSVPSLPEKPSTLVQAAQLASPSAQAAGDVPQVDPTEEMIKQAKRAAAGAQVWIDDKLQECDFGATLRSITDSASRLGTGVVRGPVPTVIRSTKREFDAASGVEKITILEEVVPASSDVSVWDCYPDPACGDDIHDGQFFIEHGRMVEKQVRDLIGQPGYIQSALMHVIEQGPTSDSAAVLTQMPHESQDPSAKRYHVWYYHGFLKREDVIAMNCDCSEEDEIANIGIPVVITIINDTPVKAHLMPVGNGRFPYDFMCWQKVAGSPFGIGIARQIRSCQAILNSHVRAMMENAGLASGPQIVIARGSVMPADGSWEITPRKVWFLKADGDIQDTSQAINAFQIPSIQADLLAAIEFALKMAENVTGLPILLQGQQGQNGVPETVGGMQILVANASSLLRRMARIFDDSLIKPHIQAYYTYMLIYAEDPSIKGDFKVVAHGSTSLVTRDQRNVFVTQVAPQMMANPAFGIDPTRLFKKIAEISGLTNAEELMFSPQEMAALQKAQAEQAQGDIKLQVAQIVANAKLQAAQMENETDRMRVQRDIDRDTIYVEAETHRTEVAAQTKLAELQLRRELAMLEYANSQKITLDQLKAKLVIEGGRNDLARELATLPSVKEVAEGIRPGDQVTGSEPPGKAPGGMGQVL